MSDQNDHPTLRGLRGARLHRPGRDPVSVDVAINAGRLTGIGPSGTLQGPDVLDADGAWVHPGFVDSHLHFSLGGETLRQLDLSGIRSRAAFEAAIERRAAELPPGRWLQALGWNEANWPGGETPDKSWLRAAGDRPVVCYRMDFHACVVNDAVLAKLEGAECPPGGRIGTGPDGRPNGLMVESAAWHLVNPLVPDPDPQERREAAREAAAHCARLGLVAVGSMEYAKELEEGVLPIREELGLRFLVTLLERDWPLDCTIAERFPCDEMLRVIGFKAFVDGTLGSRTAAMLEPYADDPEAGTGLLVELAERGVLEPWLQKVQTEGYSPSMHVIGDRALRLALDAADTLPEDVRSWVRFEHAQTVHPEDLPRLRGRFASMQPLHKASDALTALERLGPDRMDRFFPFRALHEAGARLAFGSDWPIVGCDPFAGIRAAVTGRDLEGGIHQPEACLPVEVAIAAYTTEARACLGCDGGTLAEGEPADLVLLDRDPLTLDWHEEDAPEVLATVVAGRIIQERR